MAETSSAFLGVNIDSACSSGARLDFGDADLVDALRMAPQAWAGAGIADDASDGGSAADDLRTFVNDKTHGQIFLEQYWDEIVAFAEGRV